MSPDILKQSSDKPNAAIRKRTLVKVTVCFRYHHKTTPPLALQILYNGCSFFGGNKNILKREKARHSRNSLTVPYIRKGWTGKTVEGDQGQSVWDCHSHITVKIREKRRVFNPSTAAPGETRFTLMTLILLWWYRSEALITWHFQSFTPYDLVYRSVKLSAKLNMYPHTEGKENSGTGLIQKRPSRKHTIWSWIMEVV